MKPSFLVSEENVIFYFLGINDTKVEIEYGLL